jgi:hypothetical protein
MRFLMLESRKTVKCVGTVRFALKRKISVKTVKRKHLNRGRVRAVGASTENDRVRYGTLRYVTVRNGTVRTRSADKFGGPCSDSAPTVGRKITIYS